MLPVPIIVATRTVIFVRDTPPGSILINLVMPAAIDSASCHFRTRMVDRKLTDLDNILAFGLDSQPLSIASRWASLGRPDKVSNFKGREFIFFNRPRDLWEPNFRGCHVPENHVIGNAAQCEWRLFTVAGIK